MAKFKFKKELRKDKEYRPGYFLHRRIASYPTFSSSDPYELTDYNTITETYDIQSIPSPRSKGEILHVALLNHIQQKEWQLL